MAELISTEIQGATNKATLLRTTDGREVATVWVDRDLVHWDDPIECTVHTGTPWKFAAWLMDRKRRIL